jgi:hypothetical protein
VVSDKGGAFAWRRKWLQTPFRVQWAAEYGGPAASVGFTGTFEIIAVEGAGVVRKRGDPISRLTLFDRGLPSRQA